MLKELKVIQDLQDLGEQDLKVLKGHQGLLVRTVEQVLKVPKVQQDPLQIKGSKIILLNLKMF